MLVRSYTRTSKKACIHFEITPALDRVFHLSATWRSMARYAVKSRRDLEMYACFFGSSGIVTIVIKLRIFCRVPGSVRTGYVKARYCCLYGI